jgi:hypothetical protein
VGPRCAGKAAIPEGTDQAIVASLQLALARKAQAQCDTIMPGFTHLQSAQPVTFGPATRLSRTMAQGPDRGIGATAPMRAALGVHDITS